MKGMSYNENKNELSFDMKFEIDKDAIFSFNRSLEEDLKEVLNKIDNLEYKLICKTSKNNYQKTQHLDQAIRDKLKIDKKQQKRIYFDENLNISDFNDKKNKIPNMRIEHDCLYNYRDKKIFFEIEKANFEKILYDVMKMHVYCSDDKSYGILLFPKQWFNKSNVAIYDYAITRYKICNKYGMLDNVIKNKILIIGYNQELKTGTNKFVSMDDKYFEIIHEKCKIHIKT